MPHRALQFFNRPIVVVDDRKHIGKEHRWHALGVTDAGRRLHITFTVRGTLIRVISDRDMHKKERMLYEQTAYIKSEANRRDVPYQSLIKIWLAERAQAELDR